MEGLLSGKRISVVIPAYREALGVANTITAVEQELARELDDYEIVVVDDGSPDDTFARIQEVATAKPCVRGLRLSRNFGKEAALLAGLRVATGDAVITMDADLKHPPAMISDMIRAWRGGAMVVNAVKRNRGSEHPFVRWRAAAFNALFTKLSGINILHASDFKLLDRQAVNIIIQSFPEKMRFYRGLTEWIGFKQVNLPFDVHVRHAGQDPYAIRSLTRFALGALVSFTSTPLRFVTLLGVVVMALGSIIAADAIASWARGDTVSGFTTLIITLLFLGSSILVSLGIIGEYVAKIYNEIKGRPTYLIASTCGLQEGLRHRVAKPESPMKLLK